MKFYHALLDFIDNKDANKLIESLKKLSPEELQKINDPIYYEGTHLSPLSILIRMAYKIESPFF